MLQRIVSNPNYVNRVIHFINLTKRDTPIVFYANNPCRLYTNKMAEKLNIKIWLSTSLKLNRLSHQNQGTIFLDTRLRGYDDSRLFNDE